VKLSGLYAPRWSDLEGDECAAALLAVVDSLEKQDTTRRARAQLHLGLYEGRPVSLDSDDFFQDVGRLQPLPPLYNLIRSACDTAQADIAGRQKPKPMFMTTGADWKARRRAKKLDKFVEAQMCQSQGQYADSWQLMIDCFLDSARLGTGIAKVFADVDAKKVRVERVLLWELHVDEREARYGAPRNIFHGYDMERDLAIETFCNVDGDEDGNERRRNALLSAQASRATGRRVVESVHIREGWKLPISDKKPGKHAIAVDGCMLFEEPWTRPRFPFLKLVWNRQSIGYWGVGIAANGEAMQDCVSDTASRLRKRIQICATKRTYYNANATKREDLEQGGDSELLIACQDMTQMPQEVPVSPASQAEFEWLNECKDGFFETEGISQMTAAAQKPAGVTAGVAMQTLNDIQTVRFLPKARAYETSFETLGQLMCDAAKDIAEQHGGYLVQWPGKRFLKELDWNEVSLEEDMYQIRVAPVSQFSRDPAAILQIAKEFRDAGEITRETYLQMVGMPDFEEMLGRETAESEYVRDLMDRYLDSTDDDELEKNGGFETPEPFLANVAGAAAICIATYWEAKRDQAPEFCLDLIRRYIVELKGVIDQAGQEAQAAAAAQQQAGNFLAPGAQVQTERAGASLVGGPAAVAA
jgi:hypothetical protein